MEDILEGITLNLFSTQDIKDQCRVVITKPTFLDDEPGSLSDPLMGPKSKSIVCSVSGCARPRDRYCTHSCLGHFGHVKLSMPIITPIAVQTAINVLSCVCPSCGQLKISPASMELGGFLNLSGYTRLKALAVRCNGKPCDRSTSESDFCCSNTPTRMYKPESLAKKNKLENMGRSTLFFYEIAPDKTKYGLEIDEIMMLLRAADHYSEDLGFIDNSKPSDCVMELFIILPPMYRPISKGAQDPFTTLYANIIQENIKLKELLRECPFVSPWENNLSMQLEPKENKVTVEPINSFMLGVQDKEVKIAHSGSNYASWGGKTNYVARAVRHNKLYGLIYDLYRKETSCSKTHYTSNATFKTYTELMNSKLSLIRGMASKTTNQIARITATGNVKLGVSDVIIPSDIASKLTAPIPVLSWNKERLEYLLSEECVMRVNEIYVGPDEQRRGMAKIQIGDVIHVPIRNGDIGFLTRSPVLTYMSGQAANIYVDESENRSQTATVSPLANDCYNLDYDGDEINVIIPQLGEVLIDAIIHARVDRNILSKLAPINKIGMLEQLILSAYKLSNDTNNIPDSLYSNVWAQMSKASKADMNTLVMRLNIHNVKEKSPRGFLSMILPEHLTYNSGGVKIRNGVFLSGSLTGSHVGKGPSTLIKEVGFQDPGRVKDFLEDLGKLLTSYMEYSDFSLSLNDIISEKDVLVKLETKINDSVTLDTKNKDLISAFEEMRKLIRIPFKDFTVKLEEYEEILTDSNGNNKDYEILKSKLEEVRRKQKTLLPQEFLEVFRMKLENLYTDNIINGNDYVFILNLFFSLPRRITCPEREIFTIVSEVNLMVRKRIVGSTCMSTKLTAERIEKDLKVLGQAIFLSFMKMRELKDPIRKGGVQSKIEKLSTLVYSNPTTEEWGLKIENDTIRMIYAASLSIASKDLVKIFRGGNARDIIESKAKSSEEDISRFVRYNFTKPPNSKDILVETGDKSTERTSIYSEKGVPYIPGSKSFFQEGSSYYNSISPANQLASSINQRNLESLGKGEAVSKTGTMFRGEFLSLGDGISMFDGTTREKNGDITFFSTQIDRYATQKLKTVNSSTGGRIQTPFDVRSISEIIKSKLLMDDSIKNYKGVHISENDIEIVEIELEKNDLLLKNLKSKAKEELKRQFPNSNVINFKMREGKVLLKTNSNDLYLVEDTLDAKTLVTKDNVLVKKIVLVGFNKDFESVLNTIFELDSKLQDLYISKKSAERGTRTAGLVKIEKPHIPRERQVTGIYETARECSSVLKSRYIQLLNGDEPFFKIPSNDEEVAEMEIDGGFLKEREYRAKRRMRALTNSRNVHNPFSLLGRTVSDKNLNKTYINLKDLYRKSVAENVEGQAFIDVCCAIAKFEVLNDLVLRLTDEEFLEERVFELKKARAIALKEGRKGLILDTAPGVSPYVFCSIDPVKVAIEEKSRGLLKYQVVRGENLENLAINNLLEEHQHVLNERRLKVSIAAFGEIETLSTAASRELVNSNNLEIYAMNLTKKMIKAEMMKISQKETREFPLRQEIWKSEDLIPYTI